MTGHRGVASLVFATSLVVSVRAVAADNPQVVVLVSGRTGVDKEATENIAEAVSAALGNNGFAIAASPQAAATKLQLEGVADTATCSGRADCVALMAKGFSPAIVVGISVGKVGAKKIAVAMAAVPPNKPQEIAKGAFVLARANLEEPDVREPVAKFAKTLHATLAKHPEYVATAAPPPPPPPKEEPKPEPAPVATTGTPSTTTPAPEAATTVTAPAPEPAPGRRTWALGAGIAVGVLAVGAAGVGGFEGAGAMSQGAALRNNPNATLTQWQAAGGQAQLADICYGGAVVLAAAAVVLLVLGMKSPAPSADPGSGPGMTWNF